MRKLSINALFLFAGDGGARLLTFLATIHIARTLGTDGFGSIVLGMTALSYALWFSDLGLGTLGTRELAKPREKREFALADIFSLKAFLALLMFLVGEVLVFLFLEDPTTRYVAALYLFAVFPTALMLEWYYQGIRKYLTITIARYLFGGLYALGIYALLSSTDDILFVPLCYIGAMTVSALFLVIRREPEDSVLALEQASGARTERWKAALQRSTPIGFGSVFAEVVQLLPPIVIAWLYSETDVGVFGAALRISIFLLILDKVFIALFLPAVSRIWASERERFTRVLRSVFRWMTIGSIIVSLSVTLASGELLALLFDAEFAAAATPLAIMSWFVTATLLNSFFAYSLIASGIERAYFQSSIWSAGFAVVAIIVLTWLFGVNGAAVGVTASEFVMAGLMYLKFREHLKVRLL